MGKDGRVNQTWEGTALPSFWFGLTWEIKLVKRHTITLRLPGRQRPNDQSQFRQLLSAVGGRSTASPGLMTCWWHDMHDDSCDLDTFSRQCLVSHWYPMDALVHHSAPNMIKIHHDTSWYNYSLFWLPILFPPCNGMAHSARSTDSAKQRMASRGALDKLEESSFIEVWVPAQSERVQHWVPSESIDFSSLPWIELQFWVLRWYCHHEDRVRTTSESNQYFELLKPSIFHH